MADELPFGRYEYAPNKSIWLQFKPGPYRMKTKREWDATRDEAEVFAFLLRYIDEWHLTDVDGNEVPLPEAPKRDKDGKIPEDWISWTDNLDVALFSFMITSFAWLINRDAARPPKV